MKPIFDTAIATPQRIVFAEGESQRVINAVQILVDDKICKPILIGDPETIQQKIDFYNLRLRIGEDIDIIDPINNPEIDKYCDEFYQLMSRKGVTPAYAKQVISTRHTALASVLVRLGKADAMLCGVQGNFVSHLRHIKSLIGTKGVTKEISSVCMMINKTGTFFLTDTHVTVSPSAQDIVDNTLLAAELIKQFGFEPKVALLSHSNFGSRNNRSSIKMREALKTLHEKQPDLLVEGEMHADAALSSKIRDRLFTDSSFKGAANLLVCPSLDAGNIAYNIVKKTADGATVGPMLVGTNHSAHILTESTTVRGIVNMAAFAAVDALQRKPK